MYEKLNSKNHIEDNPKVFVSYSHDNEEHKAWVEKLSTHLRYHGVDVILDKWDSIFGEDLPFFMETGLNNSHLVLCVCSENYVKKCDNLEGGTGYEKRILSNKLINNNNKNFIIPIIRNNNSDQMFPTFLGDPLALDFRKDKDYYISYEKLIRRIHNQVNKPQLGENPFKKNLGQKIIEKTNIDEVKYLSPEMEGTVEFDYTNNNGFYKLGYGNYLFNTKWSTAGDGSIYALTKGYGNNLMLGFSRDFTDFPKREDIIKFNFSSNSRHVHTGSVIIYMNPAEKFVAIKLGEILDESRGHKKSKLVFNYKIYNDIYD